MYLGFIPAPATGFDAILQQIETAEAAAFDFVWLPDGAAVSAVGAGVQLPYEPTLLASALATRTREIGLLVTAAPARHEPYNLARRLASLDWISHGRIGWMVDAGADAAREDEYVRLVGDLWDSWDDDAFLYDKAAGRFFTPSKMHVLDHHGPHFSVRGPLNVNRPPQGRPIIAAVAGSSIAVQAELILLPEGGAATCAAASNASREVRQLAIWRNLDNAGTDLIDRLETERDRRALDGFILAPSSPSELQRFIDQVVPELQHRGLLERARGAQTFRERLSLPRPALPAKLEVSA